MNKKKWILRIRQDEGSLKSIFIIQEESGEILLAIKGFTKEMAILEQIVEEHNQKHVSQINTEKSVGETKT
jgi:hypothetical protein